MISAAAIEESGLSFLLRCALVGWLCCGLLAVVDRRKSAAAYQVLFSLAMLLLTVRGWVVAETLNWAWGLGSLAAVGWTLSAMRRWLFVQPADVHQESLPAQPRKVAKKVGRAKRKPRAVVKPSPQSASTTTDHPRIAWRPLELAMLFVGVMLTVAVVWPYDLLAAKNATLVQAVVVGHLLASCGLLALSLVVATELTVLSSPDGLATQPRVAWWWLARWGLLFATLELLVSLAVLVDFGASPGSEMLTLDSAASDQLLIQRVFALALTACAGIAWVVPNRVAQYQRRGDIPRDWVSMALASWLVCLALAVVCFLPTGWPLLLEAS